MPPTEREESQRQTQRQRERKGERHYYAKGHGKHTICLDHHLSLLQMFKKSLKGYPASFYSYVCSLASRLERKLEKILNGHYFNGKVPSDIYVRLD